MSKLRKVQFFRNSSLTAYANHDAAVTAAKAAWTAQDFANMEDGELLLYRYTISGETDTPAHTIVGVVRNNNGTKDFEVLANYDMFSGSISSLNVADYAQAKIDTTTVSTETTITIKGIQENAGLISAADDTSTNIDIKVDGTYNASSNKIATQSTVTNAIQGLAVNSVSETVGVGTVTDGASITDTLTVDGNASTQTVNVVATQGVSVTPDASTQTITLAAKVADYAHVQNTTTVATETDAYNLLKVDASGNLSVSDTWDCGVYS